MAENNDELPPKTVQIELSEWKGAPVAIDLVQVYLHERAPKLKTVAWWRRAIELAYADATDIGELRTELSSAGLSQPEANVASAAALWATRCERFLIAGDIPKSIAAGQVAYMHAGFLLGMTGFTPEELDQRIKVDRSERSRHALNAKHKEVRDIKQQAIDYYLAHIGRFGSKDEAALEISQKIVPASFSTVRRKYLKDLPAPQKHNRHLA